MGQLSILVNVAGGGVGGGRTVGRGSVPHDKDSFVQTMAMNATGTFNVTRLVAAAIGEGEPDEDGQRGSWSTRPRSPAWKARADRWPTPPAKAAILGMTLPMARDLAAIGVRVCAIAPGVIGTPLMIGALPASEGGPAAGIVFPKRMGYPEEFATDGGVDRPDPYLNGENIRLDGALRFTAK